MKQTTSKPAATEATDHAATEVKLTLAEAQRKGATDRLTTAYALARTANEQAENAYRSTKPNTDQRTNIEPVYQLAHSAYAEVVDLAGEAPFTESTAEVQVLARKAEQAAAAAVWLARKAVRLAR